ncbi:uncharacterized protein J4E92_004976 [Alternaria infectoria]|uniref:uncharacterized protein n=2 Tax=Alternaria sect. Infectoriae TaxID=2499258 RepID=UPI00221FA2DF|nr:uncharacterized protein J4E86_007423 [Alternaria arbusti]XP_051353080.1 uncharacterized protein J4E92_004976 [Alternaria infectoria]KAI4929312.1 hypothetical protein J4E92_004976 [Alternaria infectoria]KAI4950915.1 hypothetical protein J4E86_007423 [Alternaria arbusti]
MSGPGENRWRRQGQANRNSNSGANTPTKDNAGRQQAMPAPTGNVWGAKQGKGSGPAAAPAQAQPDQHVPVKEFNANEVRDFLKKKYLESTANQPSVYHKVPGDSVPTRSTGAWGKGGTMTHLMPTGQDFFTQLKKQIASLEQTKPAQ